MRSSSVLSRAAVSLVAVALFTSTAAAQDSGSGGGACNIQDTLKGIESAGSGGYGATGRSSSATGAYQMMQGALNDTGYMDGSRWTGKDGIYNRQQFLANKEVQDKAQQEYGDELWRQMQTNGAANYLGQNVGGVTMTKDVMIAGAWNPGAGGFNTWLKNGGQCTAAIRDANGTCASKYVNAQASCSGQSTQQAAANLDKTSKTCATTVPVLQAINCANFPGEVAAFCTQYKPFLMNMSECQAAETYAQNAPPNGNEKVNCENQTFGLGTSSWSYVLACAPSTPGHNPPAGNYNGPATSGSGVAGSNIMTQYATSLQGTRVPPTPNNPNIPGTNIPQPGGPAVAPSITGTVPAGTSTPVGDGAGCANRLKERNVDFRWVGTKGSGQCTISNSVDWKPTGMVLDYDGKNVSRVRYIDCLLVEKMEDFFAKIKGIGVTGIGYAGAYNCRKIANSNKWSNHTQGKAIDQTSWVVSGQRINVNDYYRNPSYGNFFQQMTNAACSSVPGVLFVKFYANKKTRDLHMEILPTGCIG